MEYYEVAAKWWADKIRNVGPSNFNNGDDSSTGDIAMMMATIDKEPSNQEADMFEKQLAELIKEKVEKCGTMSLSVDYVPDYNLGEIAKEVGVDPFVFPWKTSMSIKKDSISVSCGYAAPFVSIYPETK